jgi:hypothetical protein
MNAKTLAEAKRQANWNFTDGTLPAVCWPGAYVLHYYTRDGELLCAECAATEEGPCTIQMYQEGPTLYCEECNKEMPSDYGDPDADDNN